MIIEHPELAASNTNNYIGGTPSKRIFIRPHKEGYFQAVKAKLANFELIASSNSKQLAHFGIGGYRNLDLMASLQLETLVLTDINQHQLAFWKLFAECIQKSQSREDFIENLAANMFRVDYQYLLYLVRNEDINGYFQKALPLIDLEKLSNSDRENLKDLEESITSHYKCIGELEKEKDNTLYFWLATEERFQRIRSLFLSGKVHLIHLDLLDPDNIQKVSEWFKKENISIGSIYTSNLVSYISEDETLLQKFCESLRHLSPEGNAIHFYTDCEMLGNKVEHVKSTIKFLTQKEQQLRQEKEAIESRGYASMSR